MIENEKYWKYFLFPSTVFDCIYVYIGDWKFQRGKFSQEERTPLLNNVRKHRNVIRRATLQTNEVKVTNCWTLNCVTEYEITQRYKEECKVLREKTRCYPRKFPNGTQTNALKNLNYCPLWVVAFLINSIAFDWRDKETSISNTIGNLLNLPLKYRKIIISCPIESYLEILISKVFLLFIVREICRNKNSSKKSFSICYRSLLSRTMRMLVEEDRRFLRV